MFKEVGYRHLVCYRFRAGYLLYAVSYGFVKLLSAVRDHYVLGVFPLAIFACLPLVDGLV